MADPKLLAEWFWVDRWTGSTAFGLSLEARGLYREMLSQAWRRGAKLPNNHEAVRRMVGATEKEWRRCWPTVSAYWRVDGDDLVNDTQMSVYAEALAREDVKSNRGREGARARWDKERKQSPSTAQAMLKHPAGIAQASPEHVLEQCPPISDLRSPERSSGSQPDPNLGAVPVPIGRARQTRRPTLIASPLEFEAKHGKHFTGFCDFVCLPQFLVDGWVNRIVSAGRTEAQALAHVQTFAGAVRDRWQASGQVPGEDELEFWRREWKAAHTATAARPAQANAGGVPSAEETSAMLARVRAEAGR